MIGFNSVDSSIIGSTSCNTLHPGICPISESLYSVITRQQI